MNPLRKVRKLKRERKMYKKWRWKNVTEKGKAEKGKIKIRMEGKEKRTGKRKGQKKNRY